MNPSYDKRKGNHDAHFHATCTEGAQRIVRMEKCSYKGAAGEQTDERFPPLLISRYLSPSADISRQASLPRVSPSIHPHPLPLSFPPSLLMSGLGGTVAITWGVSGGACDSRTIPLFFFRPFVELWYLWLFIFHVASLLGRRRHHHRLRL